MGVRVAVVSLLFIAALASPSRAQSGNGGYEQLVALFNDWRAFQRPKLVDGVPDYSARAMAAQFAELPRLRSRLAAINPASWPVEQQVDYHIVRAEMNGLDFDHRVIQPWARNPAFYSRIFPSQSDQPAREGHFAYGGIELWTYRFPLAADRKAELSAALRTIPPLLTQARSNLTGNARDLWVAGIREMDGQVRNLDALASQVKGDAQLTGDVAKAREAVVAFRDWLQQQAPSKTGPSGIGIDNYNWYLRNVTLVPYTWDEEVAVMRRELARAHADLKLEEQRNRGMPELQPLTTAEEHARKFDEAVREYMAFLEDADIITIKDYMEPALRARQGRFNPGPREFFSEVDYRDRLVMRTHDWHWFDLAAMQKEPHQSPIRRGPLLYNIFTGRTEGNATGIEEMLMHAGLFDKHPRGRELIYVLLAERAARALGDLMMHANRFTHQEAVQFASDWTPRGWLPVTGNTDWHEQHLYLQQPTYGTSYVIGKIEIENLMAERTRQLGSAFTIRKFMDEFNAAGLIPVSLIRWQLTGNKDPILDSVVP